MNQVNLYTEMLNKSQNIHVNAERRCLLVVEKEAAMELTCGYLIAMMFQFLPLFTSSQWDSTTEADGSDPLIVDTAQRP